MPEQDKEKAVIESQGKKNLEDKGKEIFHTTSDKKPSLNILGKMDVSSLKTSKQNIKNNLKDGESRIGVFREGKYNFKNHIEDKETHYSIEVREILDRESLIDGDTVSYELRSEPNRNNPEKKFWYAVKVHFKE